MCEPPPKKARIKTYTKEEGNVFLKDKEAAIVRSQFEKHCSHFADFERLKREYYKFHTLHRAHPGLCLAPSPLIESFWKAHIICTRQYKKFCRRVHGKRKYIHRDHIPDEDAKQCYELTKKHYSVTFGSMALNQDIWPDSLVEKEEEKNKEAMARESETDTDSHSSEDNNTDDNDDDDEDILTSQKYVQRYGARRGRTRKELAQWHFEFVNKPENIDYDPWDETRPIQNCMAGHRWIKHEFQLACVWCRSNSNLLIDDR